MQCKLPKVGYVCLISLQKKDNAPFFIKEKQLTLYKIHFHGIKKFHNRQILHYKSYIATYFSFEWQFIGYRDGISLEVVQRQQPV